MTISDDELKNAFRMFFQPHADITGEFLNPENIKSLSVIDEKKQVFLAYLLTEAEKDLERGDSDLMRLILNYLQLTRSINGQGIAALISLTNWNYRGD